MHFKGEKKTLAGEERTKFSVFYVWRRDSWNYFTLTLGTAIFKQLDFSCPLKKWKKTLQEWMNKDENV